MLDTQLFTRLVLSFTISMIVVGISVWVMPSFLVPVAWLLSWFAEFAVMTVIAYLHLVDKRVTEYVKTH